MNTQKMGYTLEETLEEDENSEEEAEEEEEEEDDASVLQVAIRGDGDCFYSAIVEAFLKDGVDIVQIFAGRVGCEVEFFQYLDLK